MTVLIILLVIAAVGIIFGSGWIYKNNIDKEKDLQNGQEQVQRDAEAQIE